MIDTAKAAAIRKKVDRSVKLNIIILATPNPSYLVGQGRALAEPSWVCLMKYQPKRLIPHF